MTERTARQIVLAARPHGRVQLSHFRVEETTVQVPGAGQILLAVQYLSLDPYMRGRMDDRKSYAKPVQIGEVMVGESVATVIASNHSGYAEGDTVAAPTGCPRLHTFCRTARAFANSTPGWLRLQRLWAYWACLVSRRIPACILSASRLLGRQWSWRRQADRLDRWLDSLPKSRARGRSASPGPGQVPLREGRASLRRGN